MSASSPWGRPWDLPFDVTEYDDPSRNAVNNVLWALRPFGVIDSVYIDRTNSPNQWTITFMPDTPKTTTPAMLHYRVMTDEAGDRLEEVLDVLQDHQIIEAWARICTARLSFVITYWKRMRPVESD